MRNGNIVRGVIPVVLINLFWTTGIIFFFFHRCSAVQQVFLWAFLTISGFYFGRRMLLSQIHWIPLHDQNAPEITLIAQKISQSLKMNLPQMGWLPVSQANVLTFSYKKTGLILITQGVLDRLSPDEIELLISRELLRLKKRYIQVAEWASFWPCLIEKMAHAISWILMISENRRELKEGILAKALFSFSDFFSKIWLVLSESFRDFNSEEKELPGYPERSVLLAKAFKSLGPCSVSENWEGPFVLKKMFMAYPCLEKPRYFMSSQVSAEKGLDLLIK